MKISKEEIEQRIRRFEEKCKESGVRITIQRLEMFREIAQSEDHPDAESLFQRVKKRIPTISLDTVYRTLWLFNDLGLITTLGLSRERTRFDANLSHHHHFVCTKCGLTRDFYSEKCDNPELPESITQIGIPLTTHIEIRGICRKCKSKVKTNNKKNGVKK